MNSKVYIIILNFNGHHDTIECLESLYKLSHHNTQIIVIDNSKTGESLNQIKLWALGDSYKEVPTCHKRIVYPLQPKPIKFKIISQKESESNFYDEPLLIIKAEENRGFSAGNNIGLRYAQRKNDFEYCWILNNDTVVEKDSLTKQILFFRENIERKIGILGSKLIYYDNPKEIQAIGGKFNSTFMVSSPIGAGKERKTKKSQLGLIDYVVGASMLVSVRFLKEVGLLSEDYFLYYEELDWVYRAKDKGWAIDWCEDSIVHHKEGVSIGTSSNYKARSFFSEVHTFKSRKIFVKKHKLNKSIFYISSVLIIFNRVRRFQFKLANALLKELLND